MSPVQLGRHLSIVQLLDGVCAMRVCPFGDGPGACVLVDEPHRQLLDVVMEELIGTLLDWNISCWDCFQKVAVHVLSNLVDDAQQDELCHTGSAVLPWLGLRGRRVSFPTIRSTTLSVYPLT